MLIHIKAIYFFRKQLTASPLQGVNRRNSRCQIWPFRVLIRNLIERKYRNLHVRMVFHKFHLMYLQNDSLDFIHQGLRGQFPQFRKLLNKHIAKYVTCIGTLRGRNWQKLEFVVAFLYSQTQFSWFPVSRSH